MTYARLDWANLSGSAWIGRSRRESEVYAERDVALQHSKLLGSLLYRLYHLGRRKDPRRSLRVHEILLAHELPLNGVSFHRLEAAYDWLASELTVQWQKANGRAETASELAFVKYQLPRLGRKVRRSVWIGNHCFDFFSESFKGRSNLSGGRRYTGLVFEIDGLVHEAGFKQAKDEDAEGYLYRNFGIAVVRIANPDVNSEETRKIVEALRYEALTGTRDRSRLRSKIFIETIATFAKRKVLDLPAFFNEHFGITRDALRELLILEHEIGEATKRRTGRIP